MISYEKEITNIDEGVQKLNQLTEGTNYIITSHTLKIVEDKNFAFSFIWVGAAYKRIREHSHLKFLVHPSLNYISADLIAAMGQDKQTICVAKILASKEILNPILSKSFYFSPYGIPEKIDNSDFAKEYKAYIQNFNHLKWHEALNKEEYQKKMNLWERIKLQ